MAGVTPVQVIFNADDFGVSASVNCAVERAHRDGVLTSASLMVAGNAVDEAVQLARAMPRLSVGLHVTLSGGRAVLPVHRIRHLVDSQGLLIADPVRMGLRLFTSTVAQAELQSELEAQFERFATTGLALSHVDGHMHMHMHPTVLSRLLPLASRYSARGFRLPRDDLRLALRHSPKHAALKAAWAATYAALCGGQAEKIADHGLAHTDRVYGLMQTGCMVQDYVVMVLRTAKSRTAELYFHPAVQPSDEPMGPNPGDLATLLSPAVRQAIDDRGLQLATYPTLRRRSA